MIKTELEKYGRRLKQRDRYTRVLEVSNEALLQKAEVVERERDILKGSFTKAILDMQKKSNMKRLVLEMKLNAMSTRGKSSALGSEQQVGDGAGDNVEVRDAAGDSSPSGSRSASSGSEI